MNGKPLASEGTGLDQPEARRVVVVDLDRTLIRGDTLHEQAIRLAFQKPKLLPGLLKALSTGKVAVKAYCADHIVLDPEVMNACENVLDFLRAEKAKDAHLVLCSAADRRVAEGMARYLGIFDEVIATDSDVNLKAHAKAKVLAERFPQGFVYAGDHAADLAVWEKADGIILVGTSPATTRKARALGKPIVAELRPRPTRTGGVKVWAKALRVHHWSKNVMMFVPLLLAHEWFNAEIVGSTILGFLLLLAVTSSSYLINDLADLDADRRHATKHRRPIAYGSVQLSHAAAVPILAVPLALLAAWLLNPAFALALASYLVITLAYSFGLKRIPLLDTFLIAVLFTVRLIMGATFLSTALPVWLMTFSMFFFFSMATAKRHTEVVRAGKGGGDSLRSRGYEPEDWPLTLVLGLGSGIASIVILVLYMVDEAFRRVGYANPEFLWVIAFFVAIWIGRIWLLTHRGRMDDDPVSFALTDRPSQGMAALVAICFLISL